MWTADPAQPLFSLAVGGEASQAWLKAAAIEETIRHDGAVDTRTRIYRLPDGLQFTQTVKRFSECGAVHSLLTLEHTGPADSRSLSSLYDCDIRLPFAADPPVVPGFQAASTTLKLIQVNGSNWQVDEFTPQEEPLFAGKTYTRHCKGGRSSQGLAPFFDVNHGERGVLLAIGWTGQWTASFTREEEAVRIQAGVEGVDLFLHPGERIRTASILLLPYEHGQTAAHNAFRRVIRDHFSLLGKPGRPKEGPLCLMAWGGLPSEAMKARMREQKKRRLGFEYYWIDAGWYGTSAQPCPNEHTGDWAEHTGDWRINPSYHPDGLLEVAEEARRQGMGLLLWLEPERVLAHTPLCQAHPDWFFAAEGGGVFATACGDTRLLNLGNPQALAYTIALASGLIERLGLACYRQDFNMDPLPFWSSNDEPGRTGMRQIKHIMGLYAFWDALLERFPHLLIDNCASGGRRIDIETLSRSLPLWRSDVPCTFDYKTEAAQCHNAGISWWLPFSGTGLGFIVGDKYHTRSAYGASLMVSAWGYEQAGFAEDLPYDAIRAQLEEYKRIRPYCSGDYYPLFGFPTEDTSWAGWQYDRPDKRDGIVAAFRRPDSVNDHAVVFPGGVVAEDTYLFTDEDTGETVKATGRQLLENGFSIQIDHRRESKLYRYQHE